MKFRSYVIRLICLVVIITCMTSCSFLKKKDDGLESVSSIHEQTEYVTDFTETNSGTEENVSDSRIEDSSSMTDESHNSMPEIDIPISESFPDPQNDQCDSNNAPADPMEEANGIELPNPEQDGIDTTDHSSAESISDITINSNGDLVLPEVP